MKFEDLYKKVFVAEQEAKVKSDEIASPDDFDDVEPLPLPELDTDVAPEASEEKGLAPEAAPSSEGTSTLNDYISKLDDFANTLNDPSGESLASLVSRLDKPETPFDGISGRTSTDIIAAAKTVREVAETLKNFLIHAAKK